MEAIKVLLDLARDKDVQEKLKLIYNRIKHGHIKVPIFGAGGTGKTTLGRVLAGEFKTDSLVPPYEESRNIESFPKQGELVCTLLVAPGQLERVYRWSELKPLFATGEARGLINVVAYGYHALEGFGWTESRYYEDGMSITDFMKVYLDERRGEELRLIEEIVPHVAVANKGLWMITLMNKQDLWYEQDRKVHEYYRIGPYASFIEQIRDRLGDRFKHEYLSTSLARDSLYSSDRNGQKVILAPTAGGYEQNTQSASIRGLISEINEFVRQEL